MKIKCFEFISSNFRAFLHPPSGVARFPTNRLMSTLDGPLAAIPEIITIETREK